MSLFKKWHFSPEFKCESSSETRSPLRGWYSIFPFVIPEEPDYTELGYCLLESEMLVLVQINIGNYKDKELTNEALMRIEQILDFFKKAEKNIILRFVYDAEGRGMENEPDKMSIIEMHISQLGDILCRYSMTIFVIQGIFVGSWGEMHNSRYLDKDSVFRLLQALYAASKGRCRLAVRKPVYLRMIQRYAELAGIPEMIEMTGLYNDGMLASETDFGTYGMISSEEEGAFLKEWERQEELDFQWNVCKMVPNGGEVVNDNPYNDPQSAINDLRRMHISYLNSQYDKAVLDKWKAAGYTGDDSKFCGKSVYEYIGAHLGYRYVLNKVTVEKGKKLLLEIENRGFADISETALSIELRTVSDDYVCDLKTDDKNEKISLENARERITYSLDLKEIVSGEYKAYVTMKAVSHDREIRFSNEDADDKLYIGMLKKSF